VSGLWSAVLAKKFDSCCEWMFNHCWVWTSSEVNSKVDEFYRMGYNDGCMVKVEAERSIVKSRDLTILERDTEITELTGKLETVEARYKAALDTIDTLEAALQGLPSLPAPETVPFCVDCHQGIKRGMPFHILTIRHGDCRFVGEPSSTPSEREDSQAGCVEPDSAKIGESGAFRDVSDFIKSNSESAEISDHLAMAVCHAINNHYVRHGSNNTFSFAGPIPIQITAKGKE